ncbi:MAG: hypothetical protein WBD40_01170 [Tepidisphaeraceae bacterium]
MPLASTRAMMICPAKTHPRAAGGRSAVSATDAIIRITPACSALTSGTFRRPIARSDQTSAMMLPNIGAAVMRDIRTTPAPKFLAATTPVNDPSASDAASGNVSAERSSWR